MTVGLGALTHLRGGVGSRRGHASQQPDPLQSDKLGVELGAISIREGDGSGMGMLVASTDRPHRGSEYSIIPSCKMSWEHGHGPEEVGDPCEQ